MQVEVVNILQAVFAYLCIFGVFLLVDQPRFRGLIELLICAATLMVFNLLEETGATSDVHLVTPVFSLLWGPLFLFFVVSLLDADRPPLYWAHAVPPLLALFVTEWVQGVLAFGAISQVLYAIWIGRLVYSYGATTEQVRSDAQEISLNWLIYVLTAVAALAVIDATRHTLQPYLALHILQPWYTAMTAAYLLLFSYLILKAVKQPDHLISLSRCRSLLGGPEGDRSRAEMAPIFREIERLFAEKKLFRQERLSLRHVAEEVGLHERDISRAINEVAGCNFNDYVNRFRVDDFKRRALEGHDQPLLQIALECGFSSKSSFNATFKRFEGLTPSQYLAEHSGQ